MKPVDQVQVVWRWNVAVALERERGSRRALSPTRIRTLKPILPFVCAMPHVTGEPEVTNRRVGVARLRKGRMYYR